MSAQSTLRKGRRARRRQLTLAPATVVLLALAFTMVFPLFYLASTALRPASEYGSNPFTLPSTLTLDNIVAAWDSGQLGRLTLNSLLVVTVGVTIVVLVSSAAAFAIVHLPLPTRLRSTSRAGAILLLALPASVLIVPVTSVVVDLGLMNTHLGLILVYASLQLPFGIFMMVAFFEGVPFEILEAAVVDGAGSVRQFFQIALPLARPAVATLAALTALMMWNELLFGLLILQDPSSRTITAGVALLKSAFAGSSNASVQSAGLLIATIGPLVLFAIANRSLMRGLVAGAVK